MPIRLAHFFRTGFVVAALSLGLPAVGDAGPVSPTSREGCASCGSIDGCRANRDLEAAHRARGSDRASTARIGAACQWPRVADRDGTGCRVRPPPVSF